jgi:hypothetical protein
VMNMLMLVFCIVMLCYNLKDQHRYQKLHYYLVYFDLAISYTQIHFIPSLLFSIWCEVLVVFLAFIHFISAVLKIFCVS